ERRDLVGRQRRSRGVRLRLGRALALLERRDLAVDVGDAAAVVRVEPDVDEQEDRAGEEERRGRRVDRPVVAGPPLREVPARLPPRPRRAAYAARSSGRVFRRSSKSASPPTRRPVTGTGRTGKADTAARSPSGPSSCTYTARSPGPLSRSA